MCLLLSSDLSKEDYYRFHRAFSPGIQEFIEASLLLHYMRHASLLSPKDIEISLAEQSQEGQLSFAMPVDLADYVLGVADFTGELMRLAIDSTANGDVERPFAVRLMLNEVVGYLHGPEISANVTYDLPSKCRVSKSNLGKVERTCYDITVRRAELSGVARPLPFDMGTQDNCVKVRDAVTSGKPAKRPRISDT